MQRETTSPYETPLHSIGGVHVQKVCHLGQLATATWTS